VQVPALRIHEVRITRHISFAPPVPTLDATVTRRKVVPDQRSAICPDDAIADCGFTGPDPHVVAEDGAILDYAAAVINAVAGVIANDIVAYDTITPDESGA
jgi:hypothetical protein